MSGPRWVGMDWGARGVKSMREPKNVGVWRWGCLCRFCVCVWHGDVGCGALETSLPVGVAVMVRVGRVEGVGGGKVVVGTVGSGVSVMSMSILRSSSIENNPSSMSKSSRSSRKGATDC